MAARKEMHLAIMPSDNILFIVACASFILYSTCALFDDPVFVCILVSYMYLLAHFIRSGDLSSPDSSIVCTSMTNCARGSGKRPYASGGADKMARSLVLRPYSRRLSNIHKTRFSLRGSLSPSVGHELVISRSLQPEELCTLDARGNLIYTNFDVHTGTHPTFGSTVTALQLFAHPPRPRVSASTPGHSSWYRKYCDLRITLRELLHLKNDISFEPIHTLEVPTQIPSRLCIEWHSAWHRKAELHDLSQHASASPPRRSIEGQQSWCLYLGNHSSPEPFTPVKCKPLEIELHGGWNVRASRVLSARGITPLPRLSMPKQRHTIYGFHRLPDRIYSEVFYDIIDGHSILTVETYREFVTQLVLNKMANTLNFDGDPLVSGRQDLGYIKSKVENIIGAGKHASAPWDYLDDIRYIEEDQLHTMFRRGFPSVDSVNRADGDYEQRGKDNTIRTRLGDSPSPMFAESFFRMQAMFWEDDRRLPTDQDFEVMVKQADVAIGSYVSKLAEEMRGRSWKPALDDISAWLDKSDKEVERYIAPQSGEDPNGKEYDFLHRDDCSDEDEDCEQLNLVELDLKNPVFDMPSWKASRQFREALLLLAPKKEEELVSTFSEHLSQRNVNRVFTWLHDVAVANGPEMYKGVIGVSESYFTLDKVFAHFDKAYCFQQMSTYHSKRASLMDTSSDKTSPLSQYVLGNRIPIKVVKTLKKPDPWVELSAFIPSYPEVVYHDPEETSFIKGYCTSQPDKVV